MTRGHAVKSICLGLINKSQWVYRIQSLKNTTWRVVTQSQLGWATIGLLNITFGNGRGIYLRTYELTQMCQFSGTELQARQESIKKQTEISLSLHCLHSCIELT